MASIVVDCCGRLASGTCAVLRLSWLRWLRSAPAQHVLLDGLSTVTAMAIATSCLAPLFAWRLSQREQAPDLRPLPACRFWLRSRASTISPRPWCVRCPSRLRATALRLLRFKWRRRQKNRETPVRPPPAGGLVCRRSTSTRRAPPCVLPRASARDALRLLFDRFRSVARASHTGRAMLRTRGCDPPRPASAGPPRTLREPSATTPPRDAQRLRVSSRATAPLACFRTRFPPLLMAARRPAPSGSIVHRSCDAAARGRAPTVSHRCSLRACAASFLTAWRPPRPTQGVPAAQQEPTPSGWPVRAARRRRNHHPGGSRLPKPKPTFRRPPPRKSFTIAFVQIKGGPSHLSWTETRENEFHPKKPLHLTRVGGWTGGRARAGVGVSTPTHAGAPPRDEQLFRALRARVFMRSALSRRARKNATVCKALCYPLFSCAASLVQW